MDLLRKELAKRAAEKERLASVKQQAIGGDASARCVCCAAAAVRVESPQLWLRAVGPARRSL